MAKRSGGEKVSGPPGLDVPYHAAITKLSIRLPWEICARLGYGRYRPISTPVHIRVRIAAAKWYTVLLSRDNLILSFLLLYRQSDSVNGSDFKSSPSGVGI